MTGKQHRSKPFQTTRKRKGSELAEDYTELVFELIERTGSARTCDIAEKLGVSHVTAIRAIQRLQKEGYLTTSPRQPVLLTRKGLTLAKHCKQRHELLLQYLLALGVPAPMAEIDVEGLEHHISQTTLECMEKHLALLQKQSEP